MVPAMAPELTATPSVPACRAARSARATAAAWVPEGARSSVARAVAWARAGWHRTGVRRSIAAALLAFGLLPAPVLADPLDGALVAVRVVAGFSPYSSTQYEVLWRGRVAVASHYRTLVNYDEPLHGMRLVPREGFVALLDAVERDGAFALPDAPTPGTAPAALRYEVEVRRGKRHHVFRVSCPDAQADPRYDRIVRAVRRYVLRYAGDLAFRNVFFDAGELGWLNLTSVPVARVIVDGQTLGHETPLYGYELRAGEHRVRLESVTGGLTREHTVRIQGGMTTILHMDMR